MAEPYYTVLRGFHMWGDWLAFAVAPVVLCSRKGGRRHILYGRCFLVSYIVGITAGLLLAAIRSEPIMDLSIFGWMTLFFLGSGYLAPRIARGSLPGYRWDRVLTVIGAVASGWMIVEGMKYATRQAPLPSELTFGLFGLGIAAAHAGWRGAADPARWRLEHLTGLVAAYTVSWHFVLLQYQESVPQAARGMVPLVGLPVILWVRKRVAQTTAVTEPHQAILTGAV